MRLFMRILAVAACLGAGAANAQEAGAAQTPTPQGQDRLTTLMKFLANQAAMSGAAGACEPASYTLVHSCTMQIMKNEISKLESEDLVGLIFYFMVGLFALIVLILFVLNSWLSIHLFSGY